MTDDKRSTPMDTTMPEGEAQVHVNQPRNAYAMDQLIEEVLDLFPETTYEVSNRNPRNVAFDVQFNDHSSQGLYELLSLLGDSAHNEEERIREIVLDPEGILVSFRNNAVLQDSRESFGLADAWIVLSDGAEA